MWVYFAVLNANESLDSDFLGASCLVEFEIKMHLMAAGKSRCLVNLVNFGVSEGHQKIPPPQILSVV